MACLACNLEHHAIRKPQRWPRTETLQSRRNDIAVLQGEIGVHQQHVDGGRDALGATVVHRIEHPDRFHEHQVRNQAPDETQRSADAT